MKMNNFTELCQHSFFKMDFHTELQWTSRKVNGTGGAFTVVACDLFNLFGMYYIPLRSYIHYVPSLRCLRSHATHLVRFSPSA